MKLHYFFIYYSKNLKSKLNISKKRLNIGKTTHIIWNNGLPQVLQASVDGRGRRHELHSAVLLFG